MNTKISKMSELLLIELRSILIGNSEQDSNFIQLDLNKIQSLMTINEAKICLCYLHDLGYIQNEKIDDENVLEVRLHGSGIKFVEDNMKD